MTDIYQTRPYFFFNTWFMDFFLQNIKVGGGKKIKKLLRFFLLI